MLNGGKWVLMDVFKDASVLIKKLVFLEVEKEVNWVF